MTRTIAHSLVRTLRAVPDFHDLDDDVLMQVVGASANLLWTEGSVIFDEGDPAEALYVILDGSVRIMDDDGTSALAELGEGEYFGEQSLLLHTDHARRAEAAGDCELMVIPREGFETLLDANPTLARRFRGNLESRIRETGSDTPAD